MKSTQKSSFFSILFLTAAIASYPQTKPINKFYLQGALGATSYNGGNGEVSLQTVIKNKWSATLSYQTFSMTPKNEPADYQPETGYALFIPYTYEETTEMRMINVTAGRYFKLGRNTWATTEAGLSYVQGEKVSYHPAEVVTTDILIAASTSSNYTTSKENKSTLGAAFRADVNWAFASFMGLGCGVFANVNSIQSPVGFQVKLILGYMGREKKHK